MKVSHVAERYHGTFTNISYCGKVMRKEVGFTQAGHLLNAESKGPGLQQPWKKCLKAIRKQINIICEREGVK